MVYRQQIKLHLGEDKTKTILFGTKVNIKRGEPLNIVYGNIKIKQYIKVTYLGCILDESLSGESVLCSMFLIKSTLDLDFFIDTIDSETSRFGDYDVTR